MARLRDVDAALGDVDAPVRVGVRVPGRRARPFVRVGCARDRDDDRRASAHRVPRAALARRARPPPADAVPPSDRAGRRSSAPARCSSPRGSWCRSCSTARSRSRTSSRGTRSSTTRSVRRRILGLDGVRRAVRPEPVPVLTIAAGVGLVVCLVRWRRDERAARRGRARVAARLFLFFGRSTLGPVAADSFPVPTTSSCGGTCSGCTSPGCTSSGSRLAWLGRVVIARDRRRFRTGGSLAPLAAMAAVVVVAVLVLAPAWIERAGWAATGAEWIGEQEVVRRDRRRGRRRARRHRPKFGAGPDLRRDALELGIRGTGSGRSPSTRCS